MEIVSYSRAGRAREDIVLDRQAKERKAKKTMAKKKTPAKPEDDVLTTTARAIGSTLAKLAVATGLEHPAAQVAEKTSLRKKPVKPAAKKSATAKKAPAKKAAAAARGKKKP
jgi:DNA-binding protein HU-beta